MSRTQSQSSKIDHDQDPRAAFPNLEDYLAIKTACYADYKDAFHNLPTTLELNECAKYLSKWPSTRVLDQWKVGAPDSRPQAVLETAVRYMSGCTIFKVIPEAALNVLDALHDPESSNKEDYVGHLASPADLARAHSCAAHAHYQKFRASDRERVANASAERIYRRRQTVEAGFGYPARTSLRFALHHASESARLGHVSPVVLRVGFAAREIGEGFGVDFGRLADRAKRYRPLWRAVDARANELYAEARKALEATERDPLEYVCGAQGCGTRSKSGASLKACSGKCPPDLKPRYCSKQCQVKDWSRHKAICKPGCVGKIPKIQNRLIALELFELEDPEPEPAPPSPSPALPDANPNLPAESPPHDVRPRDENPDRSVEDEEPQEGDGVNSSEDVAERAVQEVGEDENIQPVPEHTICDVDDLKEERDHDHDHDDHDDHDHDHDASSQDSDHVPLVPPGLRLTPASHPDAVQVDDAGLDRTADDDRLREDDAGPRENPEEDAEYLTQEFVEVDSTMPVVEHAPWCGDEDLQDPRDTEEGLSSPDSDRAPLTPPGLPTPPRPIVFGSISPEYLRTMWEEEGPGALTDTGVWASKVPAVFVAPCWCCHTGP